mmetsp:Transcript_9754/g.20187  ORF Transcript_9754/g.20187 Transcript_9754/m.20187 type:complete len:483 (-) Transcript_9754:665-2113(-)
MIKIGQKHVIVWLGVSLVFSLALVQTLISFALPAPCPCQQQALLVPPPPPSDCLTYKNRTESKLLRANDNPNNLPVTDNDEEKDSNDQKNASDENVADDKDETTNTDDDDATNNNEDENDTTTISSLEHSEYPYPLTCPGQTLHPQNYQVVLGYHVGMMRNWKTVVSDQLHTLRHCGLAAAVNRAFVSYAWSQAERRAVEAAPPQEEQTSPELSADLQQVWSQFGGGAAVDTTNSNNRVPQPAQSIHNHPKKKPSTNELMLSALQHVWSQQNPHLAVEPEWIPSVGSPWEGAVLNSLRQYCLEQKHKAQDDPDPYRPTVVFYLHTKGTSRYQANWREQLHQPYTYSRVLYWRKYMEYFLMERPSHCINAIVHQGALTCGVDRTPAGVYAGNFWAASCEYLVTLPKLTIYPPQVNATQSKEHYFDVETTFGKYQQARFQQQHQWPRERFVSLHQPNKEWKGFYYRLIEPSEFNHSISNVGPNV